MRRINPRFHPTVRHRPPFLALFSVAALLLSSLPLTAQDLGDEELREALSGFQEKIAADDLEGAIADLERVREQREDAPAQVDAILGALYLEAGRAEEALELLGPIADGEEANPAVLYNAGRAALALGEIETADGYLTRAVRQAPSSPAARELGLLRGRLGQTAQSYALLRQWVSQNPGDEEARVAAAAGAVQLRRPTEAEALLAELPQQDPGVRFLWGQTLLQKGDPYGAIGYLEAVLPDAPPAMQKDVRGSLADAYNLVGESAKAVDLLEGRTEGDAQMSLTLAVAQYRNGELEEAITTLRPFAESLLNNSEYRQELAPELLGSIPLEYGRMLLNDGRAQDALPYLQGAVTARPESRMAWQNLGQALIATGDRERAEQAMERFRELEQRQGETTSATAELDLEDATGKALREAMQNLGTTPERSLERIREEAAIAPSDPRPRLYEARALLLLERPDESLEVATEIARSLEGQGPLEADALYLVGSAQMALERLDDAEQALRRALEISSEHTGAMSDLAVLLISRGDEEEARQLLQKVLDLRPGDPLATAALERLDGSD